MKKIKQFITDACLCSQNIKRESGKNRILIFCDICVCAIIYGSSPNNYESFGFAYLKADKRRTYVTHRISNRIIKTNNDRNFLEIMENKAKFNHAFAEFIKRDYIELEGVSDLRLRQFYYKLATDKKCVYKPIHGSRGQGVQVLKFETYEDLATLVQTLDKDALLERWIKQEKNLSSIYPDAVCCVRVVSYLQNEEVYIFSATITFPRDGVISNASCDGLECRINEKSGVIETNAVDYNGIVYEIHPTTNKRFEGFQIEHWDEVISMVKHAARIVPDVKYVGWDIAITDDGPVLIEGNDTPGYKSLQIRNLRKDNVGLREKYQVALK